MTLRRILFICLCLTIIGTVYISKIESYIENSEVNVEQTKNVNELKKRKNTYNRYYHTNKMALDKDEYQPSLKVQLDLNEVLFQNMNIVTLGDSLTEGIGTAFNQGGFVSVLERTINEEEKIASFTNYGKLGEQTTDLRRRLNKPSVQQAIMQANIVVITVGANDMIKVMKENLFELTLESFEDERAQFEKRLGRIFKKIEDINPKVHIYVIGFYNPFEKYFNHIPEFEQIISSWNTGSERVTNKGDNRTYVPIHDIFSHNPLLLSQDNFHPNEKGYLKIAERLLEYFTKEEGEQDEL